MTGGLHTLLPLLPPAGDWVWTVPAAVLGGVAGRLLTAWVGAMLASATFGDPAARNVAVHRRIEVAAVAVALGLWWWEVRNQGLGAGGGDARGLAAEGTLIVRWIAHVVLCWLLAAAAWIDLRHRVIPDCVTVPGVLAGLTCLWLFPDALLPIAHEAPRSFWLPLLEPDVLAWWGGLRTEALPEWLGPWPHPAGLAMPAAIFSAWWFSLTVPFLSSAHAVATAGSVAAWRRIEPRTLILPIGLGAIAAAWAGGGDRFGGLQSALVGLAVSAGLVWAVREGASRALGREAMGLGDVTLMAMVGAWIGWQPSVLAFFIAAFIGLAHGAVQVVRHRESELPYGPSLCLAAVAVIVCWRPLWQWTGEAFAEPLELAAVIGAVVLLTAVTLFVWARIRG